MGKVGTLSVEEHTRVIEALGKIIDAPERLRIPEKALRGRPSCFACDSSGPRGAGVFLSRNSKGEIMYRLIYNHAWVRGSELEKSINWKETMTVLETIERARECGLLDIEGLILVAEDNTTAVSALNRLYYPGDPYIGGRFLQLFEFLGSKEQLRAIYVNTKVQAGDEPSRGKNIDPEKCRICLEELERSIAVWRKREREPQEEEVLAK